jgi:hypothetical protein
VLDCLDAGSPSGVSARASPEAPHGRTGGLSFPAGGHPTISAFLAVLRDGGAVTWIAGTIEIRSMLGAEPCRAAGAFRTSHRREQVRGIANFKADHRDLAVRISNRQS